MTAWGDEYCSCMIMIVAVLTSSSSSSSSSSKLKTSPPGAGAGATSPAVLPLGQQQTLFQHQAGRGRFKAAKKEGLSVVEKD